MSTQLISSVLTLGIIGFLFGVLLQLASNIFHVEEDDRVIAVEEALPGVNCGACGFPGCAGLANAIVEGEAPYDQCPIGGQKAAEEITKIMEGS